MDFPKLKALLDYVLKGDNDFLFDHVLEHVHCMSKPRVYAVLNAVVSSMNEHENYVEVGTYQGGSLISALQGNQTLAIGVDSFGEFTETNSLQKTLENIAFFGLQDRVQMKDMNFRDFFAQLPADFPIHVYYYDGAHDEDTQLEGMEAAWPFLRDGSIILVDDYTYPEVQRAVNRFAANHVGRLKFLLVVDPITSTDNIWWNGCVVMRVTDERGYA